MSAAYEQYLTSAEWRKVSASRRKSDGYKCVCCGATEDLNVHHLYYPSNVYDTTEDQLVTLCKDCHVLIHRIQEIYDSGTNAWGVSKTKNGFLDTETSAAWNWIAAQSMRWVVVEAWRRNLFSTKEVGEYVRSVMGIVNQSKRAKFSLNIGHIMELLSIPKDCYIANKNPTFNETRRKEKRKSKTKYH